jgi:predicted MFS family arabinose efflux permease
MTQISIALGAALCSLLLERFGPRWTNFGASVFILPAIAVQVFANSPGMLLAGKVSGLITGSTDTSPY